LFCFVFYVEEIHPNVQSNIYYHRSQAFGLLFAIVELAELAELATAAAAASLSIVLASIMMFYDVNYYYLAR
jgi:hypothetical protein